jgi:hypothetical protein
MQPAADQGQDAAKTKTAWRRSQRDLKRRPRPQLLVREELDGRTGPAKAYDRLVASIVTDLGGPESCSTLEMNLIGAYAGAWLQVENLNCRQLLGEAIDLAVYCQCASTMTRIASRLGLQRRPRNVEEVTLSRYLADMGGSPAETVNDLLEDPEDAP